jgi:desulfoferrodoxin (superoxide reductase-like protein)
MRKIIILAIVLCFAFSVPAFAHPPQNVSVAIVDKDLEVSISHPVKDLKQHYIYKIIVKINDQVSKEELFTSQPDNDFKVIIPLPEFKIGDVISASAYCNKGGEKTATLTVSEIMDQPVVGQKEVVVPEAQNP